MVVVMVALQGQGYHPRTHYVLTTYQSPRCYKDLLANEDLKPRLQILRNSKDNGDNKR